MALTQSCYGTGRRKSASARVFIIPAQSEQGNMTVNNIQIDKYFPEVAALKFVYQPLAVLGLEGKFDIYATVKGGGKSGQKGAIRLGLAKALVALENSGKPLPEALQSMPSEEGETIEKQSLYRRLRKAGKLTTTDARRVERKLPGLHKARKRAQYSKR